MRGASCRQLQPSGGDQHRASAGRVAGHRHPDRMVGQAGMPQGDDRRGLGGDVPARHGHRDRRPVSPRRSGGCGGVDPSAWLFRSIRETRRDAPPRRSRPRTVRCRRSSVPAVESPGQRQGVRAGRLTGLSGLPGGPLHQRRYCWQIPSSAAAAGAAFGAASGVLWRGGCRPASH